MGPRPRMPFPQGRPLMEDPAREKAIRSVFVANISFETTEEQLRAVLSEVGPVVSLKMIYDPSTGRPRGFGFCEYEDGETAMSAVRNLAGKEVNGRPLRIDSATNAPGGEFRGPGNIPSVSRGPIEPPLHGPAVPPEAAPEAITKAVASLPPEQMFELMKQMKWCIERNPEETRQLLLHNPQLAYGLLQAQVVMRIVDLETAHNLLHRDPRGPPLHQAPESRPPPSHPPQHQPPPQHHQPPPQHQQPPPHPPQHLHRQSPPSHPPQLLQRHSSPPRRLGSPGEPGFGPPRERFSAPPPPRRDERFGGPTGPPHRGPPPGHEPPGGHYGGGPPGPRPSRGPPESAPRGPRGPPHSSPSPSPSQGNLGGLTPQDQEKAALIMQVLSLSDEQIQMLPPDQRSSILKLKEQIAQSN